MTGGNIWLPKEGKTLVAYGDLNCPFCFALEERLTRYGVASKVEWRLVEHATDLPFNGDFSTPAQLEELGQEIEALQERAPDVQINLPRFRSNSRRATEAVAEATLIDPAKAHTLRRSLFLALWRDDRDISNVELLIELAREAGLPTPRGKAPAKELKLRWTSEWRENFDRIPVLRSDHGATLEGLSSPGRLQTFLRSGRLGAVTDEACEVQPLPSTGKKPS